MEAGTDLFYNNGRLKKERKNVKGKIIAVIVTVLAIGGCLAGALYYLEKQDEFYYTKIDNSRTRELEFKTSRKLKEGAFLSLEVRSFGVHKWQEVNYSDMPSKVQEKIK